jgi:hypothetical protein
VVVVCAVLCAIAEPATSGMPSRVAIIKGLMNFVLCLLFNSMQLYNGRRLVGFLAEAGLKRKRVAPAWAQVINEQVIKLN